MIIIYKKNRIIGGILNAKGVFGARMHCNCSFLGCCARLEYTKVAHADPNERKQKTGRNFPAINVGNPAFEVRHYSVKCDRKTTDIHLVLELLVMVMAKRHIYRRKFSVCTQQNQGEICSSSKREVDRKLEAPSRRELRKNSKSGRNC